MNSTRTFGVEIEFRNSAFEVRKAVAKAKLPVKQLKYTHAVLPHWKIVKDGSVAKFLKYGGELVSPVLSGNEGLADVRKAVTATASAGAITTYATGFHVHVGVSDLNLRQMKNLVKIFAKYEDVLDAFIAKSRRGNSNYYCNSNTRGASATSSYAANEGERHAMDCAALFAKVDACETIQQLVGVCGNNRYKKLNLLAYNRYQTVEFRAHEGTLDPETVAMWVELCIYLVDSAKNATLVAPRKADDKHGAARARNLWSGKESKELRAFYAKRCKELAKTNA